MCQAAISNWSTPWSLLLVFHGVSLSLSSISRSSLANRLSSLNSWTVWHTQQSILHYIANYSLPSKGLCKSLISLAAQFLFFPLALLLRNENTKNLGDSCRRIRGCGQSSCWMSSLQDSFKTISPAGQLALIFPTWSLQRAVPRSIKQIVPCRCMFRFTG